MKRILPVALAVCSTVSCHREASDSKARAQHTASAASSGPVPSAAPALPSESEALALAEALPTVKALASAAMAHAKLAVRVIAAPQSGPTREQDNWLIAVGTPDIFAPDGKIAGRE